VSSRKTASEKIGKRTDEKGHVETLVETQMENAAGKCSWKMQLENAGERAALQGRVKAF
jgi:hypothetical protein